MIGKEFQLEEREDKETSITEIWLQGDGSVTFGVTDGPTVEKAWGIWTLQQNGQFWMEIIRTFASSEERLGAHQIGPVHYQVKREFVGSLERIGGNVMTVKGTIHGDDESTGANLDCEVGYFSLIDEATEFDKLSP